MPIFDANRIAIYDSVIGRMILIYFVGVLYADTRYFLPTTPSLVEKGIQQKGLV